MARYEVQIVYVSGDSRVATEVHDCEEFGFNGVMNTYEVHKRDSEGLPFTIGYAADRLVRYVVFDSEGAPLAEERPE